MDKDFDLVVIGVGMAALNAVHAITAPETNLDYPLQLLSQK